MKKIIILICLISIGIRGFSQEFSKELITKAGNDLCNCIAENISDSLDVNEYFKLLTGTCVKLLISEDYHVPFEYVDENSEKHFL